MSSIEKYWFAVGFWHKKEKEYTPPSQEEIDYVKNISDYKVDILKEYEKGYKAAT
jgi:hypothetical protein